MALWQKNKASDSEHTAKAGSKWWDFIDLKKTTFLFALLSWALLLTFGLAEQSMNVSALPIESQVVLRGLLLNSLIFNIYAYNWVQLRERPLGSFYSRLWNAFVMGAVMVAASALLNLLTLWSDSSPLSFRVLVQTFVFYVEFFLLLWLLIHLFIQWKNAILYESSPFIYYAWHLFEAMVLASAVLYFFDISGIDRYVYFGYFGLLLLSSILAFNIRWLKRLTSKQRLYGVFMLLAILGSLGYFARSMFIHYSNEAIIVDEVSKSPLLGALFSFDAGYGLVALLVGLFHLLATSSFEEKFKELADIQRLNDQLQGKTRKDMLYLMLSSSMKATDADAAWLEAPGDRLFVRKNITEEESVAFQEKLKENGYDSKEFTQYEANYFIASTQRKGRFTSALAVPLKSGGQNIATLVLLKHRGSAFEGSMIHTVNAIVAQVGISLRNQQQIEQTKRSTEYRKDLGLAQKIQGHMLPENFDHPGTMEFYGISDSEDGIGGDFYDYYQLSSTKYVVLIADVAGQGISAAFAMAQLKGIFQSLAPLNLMPNEFLKQANAALAGCLEKSVFVTATYYYIETKEQKVYFSRAGHCPTLYIDSLREEARYFENNGLGLGIITTAAYENFIELNNFIYASGDIIMLYTDGILEAANETSSEEYGYQRLKSYAEASQHRPLNEIAMGLIEDVLQFIESPSIRDDYTVVLMKMK